MENWATIPDYPNYEISDNGRVRNTSTNAILKPKDTRGYNRVALYNNGSRNDVYVHRLVAEAFIHNPYDKEEINHIDGNKRNNSPTNLEWCTRNENMSHAFGAGLKFPSGGLPKKQIKVIETGQLYDSVHECARDIGGDQCHISSCLTGKRKSHKGYHFSYASEG